VIVSVIKEATAHGLVKLMTEDFIIAPDGSFVGE
jgi:hypothetical protein